MLATFGLLAFACSSESEAPLDPTPQTPVVPTNEEILQWVQDLVDLGPHRKPEGCFCWRRWPA